MKSFIEDMLEWWWPEKGDQELHSESQKTYANILEKSVYVSTVIALIVGWIWLQDLSENHQEKTKKEVVIPTKDTIHQVLNDSIMNQEDIDKEEWKEYGQQQGLSPQEIEESLQTGE